MYRAVFQCESWSSDTSQVITGTSRYDAGYNIVVSRYSLRNMYKELMDDIEGFVPPDHGYLVGWAVQGM